MERQTLMAKNPPAKAAKPSNTHNETYTKTGKKGKPTAHKNPRQLRTTGFPKCFHNGIILIVICLKFVVQR